MKELKKKHLQDINFEEAQIVVIVKNILAKGANPGYQLFSPVPTIFVPKNFFQYGRLTLDYIIKGSNVSNPKRQILDSTRQTTILKSDENGRMFSKWVENTVGKGEIARHEQFLLFPQCFQKACTADT